MVRPGITKRVATFALAAVLGMSLVGCGSSNSSSSGSGTVSEEAASALSDTSQGIAATVNGRNIGEKAVSDYIAAFRASSSLNTDREWGEWLVKNNATPESVRADVIGYYVDQLLLDQATAEFGLEVTDEELDQSLAAMKDRYANEQDFAAALAASDMTEETYKEEVLRPSLVQEKLSAAIADMAAEEPAEEDAQEAAETAEAAAEDMADGDTAQDAEHAAESAQETEKAEEAASGGAQAAAMTDAELLEFAKLNADILNGAKRSSHILFALEDEAIANEVRTQIALGKMKFEDAVKEYTIDDTTRAQAGDKGWTFFDNQTDEYREAVSKVPLNEISDVIQTADGLEIIQVTNEFNIPEDGLTSLDQIPTDIVEYLGIVAAQNNGDSADGDKTADSYALWFEQYKEKADIQINEMPAGLPYDIDLAPYEQAAEEEKAAAEGESTDQEATKEEAAK